MAWTLRRKARDAWLRFRLSRPPLFSLSRRERVGVRGVA